MRSSSKHDFAAYVESRRGRLSELIADLVRRPSENKPPYGFEAECQKYTAAHLKRCGAEVLVYEPDQAPGITDHGLFWPGRNYKGRPNVAGKIAGSGGGRSLILSGHIDTVPVGTEPWNFDPFGAEIRGDRLYGRGANDMKAGVATNLFVAEALADMGMQLKGDLMVESSC